MVMRISPSFPTSKRSPGQISGVEPYSSIQAGASPFKPAPRAGGARILWGDPAAVSAEVDWTRLRLASLRLRAREVLERGRPQPRERRKVQGLKLGSRPCVGMAIAALVVAVEGLANRRRIVEPDRHLDVV